jgi:hypothetical protein
MERGLTPNQLVPKLRAAVDDYRLLLPVVAAMRNAAMKERHWSKVFAAIGTVLQRDDTFTLQVCTAAGAGPQPCAFDTPSAGLHGAQATCARARSSCSPAHAVTHHPYLLLVLVPLQVLLDAKVGAVKDAIFATSTEATQEASLEELLGKVVAKWAGVELSVIPYKDSKDVYILGSIDNVQVRGSGCDFAQSKYCCMCLRV